MGKRSRKPKNRGHRAIPLTARNSMDRLEGEPITAVTRTKIAARYEERLADARAELAATPFPIVVEALGGEPITTLFVKGSYTVRDVKEMIEKRVNFRYVRADRLRLKFKRRALEDDRTLASYNIQIHSTLLALLDCEGPSTPPPPPASEPVGSPTPHASVLVALRETLRREVWGHVDDLQARRISVAAEVAAEVAMADYRYRSPNRDPLKNERIIKSLTALQNAITTDEADTIYFREYLDSVCGGKPLVTSMVRWPRLRRYWPRIRRRICSNCGKYTFDLSQPRLLVCGGCGEGRYCSEGCQREHWAWKHWKECGTIFGRKMNNLHATGWRMVPPTKKKMMIIAPNKETMTLARALTFVPCSIGYV